jgi:hypothetical protein
MVWRAPAPSVSAGPRTSDVNSAVPCCVRPMLGISNGVIYGVIVTCPNTEFTGDHRLRLTHA